MAELCPKCGGGGIRRSSDFLRHWSRVLSRSTKRYCPACGEKWHKVRPVAGEILSPRDRLFLGFVMIPIVVLTVAMHPFFLRDWIKTQVRAYYDAKYGTDSEKMLWKDFGRLYGSRPAAVNDYGTHGRR